MPRSNVKLLEIVAINVRALRAKAGLSQEELAELCGLHRTYIGGIERAERNITMSSLEKIAAGLRTSAATLVSAKDSRV
jgi:transcriptional regulator with XRE-family HTH domain